MAYWSGHAPAGLRRAVGILATNLSNKFPGWRL